MTTPNDLRKFVLSRKDRTYLAVPRSMLQAIQTYADGKHITLAEATYEILKAGIASLHNIKHKD